MPDAISGALEQRMGIRSRKTIELPEIGKLKNGVALTSQKAVGEFLRRQVFSRKQQAVAVAQGEAVTLLGERSRLRVPQRR